FLNDDPSSPPLPPQEVKVIEPNNEKSSIDESPVVELKDLPPHLEYVFLEGDDKLPVIISKDLNDEEKAALIKVLKSHKQALAWKLFDIKGINPEFCTHKILMEDEFKPTIQHQRRVNSKIHKVIKKESVLLLQEFDIIVRDKKGAENLAADHLSRLENPHQSVLNKTEINETFPLETLNMVSFRGDLTLKAEMAEINKNLLRVLQVNQQVKAVTPSCETCGGPHSYNDCNAIINPKEDLKGITTHSGTAYQGPTFPTTSSSLPKVVERETEVTKDTVPPTNNENTKDVQPLVVQVKTTILNSKPVVASIIEPVVAPVSASKPNQKSSIPYPSKLHDQKLRDKANDQKENFFQIFQDLNFNISFADALILMPNFGPTIKTLLTNKDKLSELARTPLPGRSRRKHKSHAKSMWNKLFLPELSPTCITLKLADRSISYPVGVAEDVYVKVGTFQFPSDFLVVDFNEAITFNLDQTSRYSANYNDMTANRINVIDMSYEEYSQEVLGFSDVIASGNPTPYYDPIVSTSSLTLTPFEDSDFLLEEVDAFLALEDDPTSLKVDHSYFDTKGDILLLKAILNDDPSLPPPTQ
nr:reverse transcriptase domain-containing protein [Tanacetum cinerariifolium]